METVLFLMKQISVDREATVVVLKQTVTITYMSHARKNRSNHHPRIIQIILTPYVSAYEVVTGFDMAACRAIYSPKIGIIM